MIARVTALTSTSDLAAVKPFAHVTITETEFDQTETVTVIPSAKANGALSDTAGGSVNATTGAWTIVNDVAGFMFQQIGSSEWIGKSVYLSD